MEGLSVQSKVHAESLQNPQSFWAHQSEQLHWHRKPKNSLHIESVARTHEGDNRTEWSWFPGGEISTCYNCIDRHVVAGAGDTPALLWDSPVTGQKAGYTYKQLKYEVETLAAVLLEQGVHKGDVVLIYMPMIPAAVFAMLAVNRIGAIHTVVFGGFSAPALAQRIEASNPKIIMTASCGVEGKKGPIAYQPLLQKAIKQSKFKPARTVIYQRAELEWTLPTSTAEEVEWQSLVNEAKRRGIKADAVAVRSSDGVYIIYTSGTTGSPKGVLRQAGGHAVGLNFTIKYIFGIRGPGDVIFTASDIGWVVGHSYIVYGPLLAGATTVLLEGKPILGNDAAIFWRIVEDYRVNTMFCAPTALRAIRKEDSENKGFEAIGRRDGLRSLKALFLAGERSEQSLVTMYQDLLSKHGADGARVIDNWWSSESGSPITAVAELPAIGKNFQTTERSASALLALRPGSAGMPMPGFDVRIVDDDGNELDRGSMGNIVLGLPLAPTALTTLWQDAPRFYRGYLQRFKGKWFDTGDAGMIDKDGYVHVMSRADDVINVAAHRLSTGAMEQAITTHPQVAECCVVALKHSLKGHVPFAFVTLSSRPHPVAAIPSATLARDLNALVREQIGPIATLGGIIVGERMIPKTRSGKTIRRTLRELLDHSVQGQFDAKVQYPSTIEDSSVIEVARAKVKEYFDHRARNSPKAQTGRAKL